MLKNVGKDGFEILGQTGVPPVTYPDLAGMARGLGWPELILPRRARGAARFSVPIPTKSIPGQNGNFFARRAARAPGQNQFWPAQPRAIPAKSGYVTGGTPV